MRSIAVGTALTLGLWLLSPGATPERLVAASSHHIQVTDDCDPNADWGANGCLRDEGSVSRAEFGAFLLSPLASAVVGHPSWRNEPGYVTLDLGQKLKVKNTGGRTHTFTEVADFGGGRVPQLSFGLTPALECAASADLLPGGRVDVADLGLGNHRFQCCIHPWMRAAVEVVPEE
jgi:hypothetical protein